MECVAATMKETNTPGVKSFDGYLDDTPMEIKAIEGCGNWSVSTKLRYAEKQHAQCVVQFWTKKPPRSRGGQFEKVLGERMGRTHTLSPLPMQRYNNFC